MNGEVEGQRSAAVLFSVTQVLSALSRSYQCFPDLCIFSSDSVNVLKKFHLLYRV